MYYGYELMWTLTFVPVGFVIVMAVSAAYCLVYLVGARRGGAAAARYLRWCSMLLAAASAANLAYALLSGDAATFLAWYGVWPLFEMLVVGMMCLGSMWFMATAYVRGELRRSGCAGEGVGGRAASSSETDAPVFGAAEEASRYA